jgi:hypothetical protein
MSRVVLAAPSAAPTEAITAAAIDHPGSPSRLKGLEPNPAKICDDHPSQSCRRTADSGASSTLTDGRLRLVAGMLAWSAACAGVADAALHWQARPRVARRLRDEQFEQPEEIIDGHRERGIANRPWATRDGPSCANRPVLAQPYASPMRCERS